MSDSAHRLGRHRRQIRAARPILLEVDLLQRENVRVEVPHRRPQPVEIHDIVADRPAVQDVESRDAHGYQFVGDPTTGMPLS